MPSFLISFPTTWTFTNPTCPNKCTWPDRVVQAGSQCPSDTVLPAEQCQKLLLTGATLAWADEQSAATAAAVPVLTPHTPVGSIPLLCHSPTSHHTPLSSCSVQALAWPPRDSFSHPRISPQVFADGGWSFWVFLLWKTASRAQKNGLCSVSADNSPCAPAPKKGRNGGNNPQVSSQETCKGRSPVLLQEERRLGGRDRWERPVTYIQVQNCFQAHALGCLISFLPFSCKSKEEEQTAVGQFREDVLQLVATWHLWVFGDHSLHRLQLVGPQCSLFCRDNSTAAWRGCSQNCAFWQILNCEHGWRWGIGQRGRVWMQEKKTKERNKNSPTELCDISPFQIMPGISVDHF